MADERTVVSIEIQTLPSKTDYTRGELLDLTGGILLVKYSDGNITTVAMDDSEVTATGYNPQKNGTQTITVSYSGQSTTFDVYVEVYKWELVGRTLSMDDIMRELKIRNRITNGVEEWG